MNMNKFQIILFYILSFTGGALTSIVGLIIILVLLPFGKVHRFHDRLYAVVGNNGGGLEIGCFFIVSKGGDTLYTKQHESGHGFQNALGGPLYIFVIGLPSAIRYGYRRIRYTDRHKSCPTSYYSIGFEKQASEGGQKIYTNNF